MDGSSGLSDESFVARDLDRAIAPAACPICAGRSFGPGPRGRMSPGGWPPRCRGCGSLERHRAQRTVFEALGPQAFAGRRALQFSPDPAVRPDWFDAFELSVYGTATGLDLAAIARPDGAYGAVVCNHVLEHVADDRAALAELGRILSPGGWAVLSVPDPVRIRATRHYGAARPDKHGHHRVYGPDVASLILQAMAGFALLAASPSDPVTGAADRCYLASRDGAFLAEAATALGRAGIPAAILGALGA